MKGFAYLLVLFALVVFAIFLAKEMYFPAETPMEPLAVFYEPYEAAQELEAYTEASTSSALTLYFLGALVAPQKFLDDVSQGGKVLKRLVRESVLIAHEEFASSYSKKYVNATCFCAPYDVFEFKAALEESASKGGLFLPRGSKSLGRPCSKAIEIYVLNISKDFVLVDVVLTNASMRFACLAQSSGFSNLALVKEHVAVDSGSNLTFPLGLNISDFLK